MGQDKDGRAENARKYKQRFLALSGGQGKKNGSVRLPSCYRFP